MVNEEIEGVLEGWIASSTELDHDEDEDEDEEE